MALKKTKSLKRSIKKTLKKKCVRKRVTKKPLRKKVKTVKKPQEPIAAKEEVVGVVTHYFPKVRAAVVKLKDTLSIGDNIHIKGHTTDFTQQVTSIQINHLPINTAKKGQEIGLLVDSRVREKDIVYRL
ncbi:MAG: hypothetical protein NC912_02295 [Candidatus Omnitrophica bacterium]|nr:hypothetical protein [Candidatus Omnitrophota bacterium]